MIGRENSPQPDLAIAVCHALYVCLWLFFPFSKAIRENRQRWIKSPHIPTTDLLLSEHSPSKREWVTIWCQVGGDSTQRKGCWHFQKSRLQRQIWLYTEALGTASSQISSSVASVYLLSLRERGYSFDSKEGGLSSDFLLRVFPFSGNPLANKGSTVRN